MVISNNLYCHAYFIGFLLDLCTSTYLEYGQALWLCHKLYPARLKSPFAVITSTKTLGFIISLIPLVFHLAVLYLLIALFTRFKQGDIFSQKNALAIKHCGYILLIGQLVGSTIYQALLSAMLTWHNPPGQRVMNISFTGTNVGVVLIALLIVLISWIMLEAYKIKEEQAYTI